MASYLNQNEIQTSLRMLVEQYVEECMNCQCLSREFVELIKHNFLAKFVYYNRKEKQIEIGVDESNSPETYPEIKVYKFPVENATQWLDKTFRNESSDLEFYGKLLNRNDLIGKSQVVLMN